MGRTIKERVIIGKGGRIEISRPDLPEGMTAEVTIVVDVPTNGDAPTTGPTLSSLLGACKGQFNSPEEADAYLRELRDEWDNS
jgi:hypothetical protein